MAADYDFVILGGTLEGRYAALSAVSYGARVALVEPPGLFFRRQQAKYLLQGLRQLGEGRRRRAVNEWFARSNQQDDEFDLGALVKWSAIAADTQQPQISADALSTQGVDVIFAMPERLSRQLVVNVANRQLKTRGVLAAFGSVPFFSSNSLGHTSAITGIEPLLEMNSLPQHIFVWGGSPQAVEWAQALNGVGVSVSLVADRLLPDEDSEVRGWVHSHLVATGIRTIDSPEASNSDTQPGTTHLHLGSTKPALMLPDFAYHPANDYPNPHEQIPERTYLLSNQCLQTAHPRVFACGSLVHGKFVDTTTSQAEAQIAVWNALFIPNKRVDYRSIPHCHYRFARIGQTPRFAKEGYSPTGDYTVFSATSANSTDLSTPIPFPSYCKLICKRGRLQSIHLLGDRADQLAGPLSSTIGQPVRQLLRFSAQSAPPITEGLSGLIQDAANQSQSTHWQPNHWRRDWAENWFNWRRSRKP